MPRVNFVKHARALYETKPSLDLPSGFNYADRLQFAAYEATGSVPGAGKVCFVRSSDSDAPDIDLAVRLKPSAAFESGRTSTAWDDGYHDYAADRPKWHLAHCQNHEACA